MSDLHSQLRDYVESTIERVDVDDVVAAASAERVPGAKPFLRRQPAWVAAGAAVVVILLMGLPLLLIGGSDSTPSDATTATTVAPTTVAPTTVAPTPITTAPPATTMDEATARREGVPYDPAIHDLCKWFSSGEITEIVSDAYEGAGATTLPDSFGAGNPSTYPPFTCGWGTEGIDISSPDWDGSGSYYLILSMDASRYASLDPALRSLSGGQVSVMEDTGSPIEMRIDDSYEPPDTLSDGLSLVGASVRDWEAWTTPGPPARWVELGQKLQVEGRPEIYLAISVISDPPLEFTSGAQGYRLVDAGLAIADTMLQRLNWLPSSNPTSDGGDR